ncbi:MAG: hypothetical protein GX774_14595 [Armatimonadetes bacterium]|nr:hypothetical protein [Armatimonadota bacterium]
MGTRGEPLVWRSRVAPGGPWAPLTYLEIRACLTALVGRRYTEFGEKPGNLRAEAIIRRHF